MAIKHPPFGCLACAGRIGRVMDLIFDLHIGAKPGIDPIQPGLIIINNFAGKRRTRFEHGTIARRRL